MLLYKVGKQVWNGGWDCHPGVGKIASMFAEGKWVMEYKQGEIVIFPENHPGFFYSTVNTAKASANSINSFIITCEVEQSDITGYIDPAYLPTLPNWYDEDEVQWAIASTIRNSYSVTRALHSRYSLDYWWVLAKKCEVLGIVHAGICSRSNNG